MSLSLVTTDRSIYADAPLLLTSKTSNSFESEMFNRASMKLGLEQAVLGDAAGSLKPRDMEDLLKKGAYALTKMDEVDAMRCVARDETDS